MRKRIALVVGAALLLLALLLIMFTPRVNATHSWNGYHWGGSGLPLSINYVDALTADWQDDLRGSLGDWNQSDVIQARIVGGSVDPAYCDLGVNVPVCNAQYGGTGWLGVASVSVDANNHIQAGSVKVNDVYFAPGSAYNTAEERRHVMCQEVAHIFGLGHTSEDGSSQNTCMDYYANLTPGDATSTRPNAHDYDELRLIYAHLGGVPTMTPVIGTPTPVIVPTATPRPTVPPTLPPNVPTTTPQPPTATTTPQPPTATATPRPPTNTPTPRPQPTATNTPTQRPPTNTPVPQQPTATPIPPTPPQTPPDAPPAFPGVLAPGGRCFVETGICMADLFARYWDANGGLRQQGIAISPTFWEISPTNGQGYWVQYFERARFEYHPENAQAHPDYLVLLGLLGREQFLARYPGGVVPPASLPQLAASNQTYTIRMVNQAWGKIVEKHGNHSTYERPLPGGGKVVTDVHWTNESDPASEPDVRP